MVLCICRAITEREIDAHVRAGASSLEAVAACCGAGTDCGACRDAIEQRIDDACASCPRRGAPDCRSASGALASHPR